MDNHISVKAAFDRLSWLASQREICVSYAETRLLSWGLDDNTKVEEVIGRLIVEGFIDHNRYAKAYVHDKFRYNNWGRVKLRANLRFKKIESNIVEEALAGIDEQEYNEKALRIAAIYLKGAKSKNSFELKGKLIRHLTAKGFETEYAYKAFDNLESSS